MYLPSILTLLPLFLFMMMTMGLAAAGNDENQMENILRKKVAAFVLHLVERAMVKKFENAKNEMNLSRNKLDNSKTWTASELSEYWSMIRGEEK